MTRRTFTAALAAALVLAPLAAPAHKPSDAYLTLAARGAALDGSWDLALRDLDDAIGLDDDGDGAITWAELRAHEAQISAYALARLRVGRGGADCALRSTGLLVDRHTDGAYAVLRFAASCPRAGDALAITYALFFEIDPSHRGLLRVVTAGGDQTAVFSPAHPTQRIALSGNGGGFGQLAAFVREGVLHIWSGFDHILFLLALLLPAVVRRVRGGWVPVEGLRPALAEVLKVVTMFTLAHSITLTLATLGVVRLPSRWVESAIALSVLLAALNNLVPLLRGRQWAFAFGFGLLHGFGFASVLVDLDLPRSALARALLGFNAGVELGQLAIVLGFVAFAYLLRRTWAYQRLLLAGGSIGIAALACVWLVERVFDLKLFL